MKRLGVSVLCTSFLIGMFAVSMVHIHPVFAHKHEARHQHQHHDSLFHVHTPDLGSSDPGPRMDAGDHAHDDAVAIGQACRPAKTKNVGASPALPAATLPPAVDPSCWSSLKVTHLRHPGTALDLTGSPLRGPPA